MADFPHVFSILPEGKLFSLMPNAPPASPPPALPASILHPFNIPEGAFSFMLEAKVPLAIAFSYAVSAKLLNMYNRSTGKKPWAISKTRGFHAFVIFHNVFLAVYSAWTFFGMLSGLRRTVLSPFGATGLAGTVDSLCHLQGKPGLGNSVYWNETSSAWSSASPASLVNGGADLNQNQMGRLWNEGIAYYGWIFYLSKFYEVLDTFIILAKGKPSSILQTYHHTGAMLCMWAGIRFMAAPIWIFILFNSFIHSLMYTYYTISALRFKVPTTVKRTLTSMQITQFLVGASSTMIHSFIAYAIPMNITHTESAAIASPAADFGMARATGTFDSLKQILFGAAPATTHDMGSSALLTSQSHTHYIVQPCITTSGETFGIWLNLVYLAPLTYLFVSFFIASYVKRSTTSEKSIGKTRRESNVTRAEKAGWDAAVKVQKEMYGRRRSSGGN